MRSEVMRITVGCAGLGLALFAIGACGRGSVRGPEVATTTSVQIVRNEDAITNITDARCDRETACNNIGAGKSYESRAACTRELGHDKRADLGVADCPRGVSGPDLKDCLNDIQAEKCGDPLDTISRLAACRKGKLCLDR